MEVYMIQEEWGCCIEETYLFFDEESAKKWYVNLVNKYHQKNYDNWDDAYYWMQTYDDLGKNDCLVYYDIISTMDEPKSI